MSAQTTAPDAWGVEGRDDQVGAGSVTTLLATTPACEDADACFRNCYAVLVRGKATRRHLFFNLPAAERAVQRAHARGDQASMLLVRLVPVGGGRDE